MDLVILASGFGRRFKGNKLLYELADKPLFLYTVEKAVEVGFESIIFVTQYDQIIAKLSDYNIKTVKNLNPEKGISYSIKLGLDNLSSNCENVMFMVCDQPFLKVRSLRCFITKYLGSNKNIGCYSYQNNMYNPVIFNQKYFAELKEIEGDVGGKKVLKKHLDDVMLFEVEKEEILDIDIKDDLDKFQKLQ